METKNKSKATSKSSKKSQTKTSSKSKTHSNSQTKSRKKSKAKKIFKKILFIISLIIFCYFAYQYYVKPYLASLDSNYEQVIDSESSSVEQSNINKTQKQTEVVKDENYVFASDYSQNNPLFFGNPSDAVFDVSVEQNYLMKKPQFTISYNNVKLIPNWVGWHLGQEDLGDAERSDKFIPDVTLPDDWYKVRKEDYQFNKYGFDRGHVCPSADKTASSEDNEATFLMTNMIPQSPNCNRIVWMHLEAYERKLVEQGNELYIFAGPYGKGGSGSRGYFEEIVINKKNGEVYNISVPASSWKVIVILPESNDDLNAVTKETEVLAVNVPNTQECKYIEGTKDSADWQNYICTINDIEQMTGYDFFELLEDNLEEHLESKSYIFE